MIHADQKKDILSLTLRVPARVPNAQCFRKLCQRTLSVHLWHGTQAYEEMAMGQNPGTPVSIKVVGKFVSMPQMWCMYRDV